MSDVLQVTLTRIVKDKLGEGATIEQVIAFLYKGASITDTTMRWHVIGTEYFRMMRDASLAGERNVSHRIEQELAERYGITPDGVRYIRNRFAAGGRRKVRRR